MKKIYNVKVDHEIVEFIRQEIIKSWPKYEEKGIGISSISIDSRALCSTDIYGFKFNGNSWDVPTINVGYFSEKKVPNPPTNLIGIEKSYGYYTYSCNTSIKLRTFLEKNPQWSNIDEWADKIKYDKVKFKYNGHNSDDRRVSVAHTNKSYDVKFPENVDSDKGLLEWVKPLEDALTTMYYRNLALDEAYNIKRGRSVYVDGLWLKYDYIDGDIEVYDVADHRGSIYSSIKKFFDYKPEFIDGIKENIRLGDLEDKIVQVIRPRHHTDGYRGSFEFLISNVDLTCCGVSWDGKNLIEGIDNAILHCRTMRYAEVKDSQMRHHNRIIHRKHKLSERGWKEVESTKSVNRDLKIDNVLEW